MGRSCCCLCAREASDVARAFNVRPAAPCRTKLGVGAGYPAPRAPPPKLGRRITVGEDKAYDTADHVTNLRAINVTPHVAQNDSITSTGKRRRSAIDGRTTRHQG